jgi:hypothetical protein
MNNMTNREYGTAKKMLKKIQKEGPADLLNKIWTDYIENTIFGKQEDISEEQNALICKLLNEISEEINGVYIDFKHGEPTTDQVFDAVYGKGAKCKLKVILYDEERSKNDRGNPAADYIIVESFVDAMNSYGANLFLAKVGLDTDGCIECETITAPDEIVESAAAKIPPEDVVRENEFWDLYYWSLQECFFVAHRCLEEGLDERWEYGHQYEMDDLYWSVKWNESGIFYEVRSESPENVYVKSIWASKKFDLQEIFPDYKVTYVSKPGIPSRIIINASDLPVRDLLNASLSFKKKLAERILVEFSKLDEFMQEASDDVKDGKLKDVMEFRSLAEVC